MDWGRCFRSFWYAAQGWRALWQREQNIRIHLVVAVVVMVLGNVVQLSLVEWGLITLTIGGMLTTEIINTAIERTVDLASDENFHPLAKQAKDIAAAACLNMALTSVCVGSIVFGPKLWHLIAMV